MQPKTTKPQGGTAPHSSTRRQLIASAVALGIMGLGAWSLLGQSAPYHPEVYDTEVTRGASDLTRTIEGN